MVTSVRLANEDAVQCHNGLLVIAVQSLSQPV